MTVCKYAPILATCFPWASTRFARTFWRHSAFFPIASQKLFAHLFLHLWPPNAWLFWALSTCEMLCEPRGPIKHENARVFSLMASSRERGIPKGRFHQWRFRGSLISSLETGWLIGWRSSVYQSLTVGSHQLHTLLLWSHREPCGACQAAWKEEIWCAGAPSINAGIFLWHFQLCGKLCVSDVLTFLIKWLWTFRHSQSKSPEVWARSRQVSSFGVLMNTRAFFQFLTVDPQMLPILQQKPVSYCFTFI